MMRLAGTSVFFALLATTAACGVGGEGDGDDDPMDPGSGSDNRDDKLGITCNASFTITGTFAAGTPARPIDPDTTQPMTGCWPVGTWTFTAAVASNECAAAPALAGTYSFVVARTDNGVDGLEESYTNRTQLAANTRTHLKVSSNGGGCMGHFEVGSPDGKKYWNFQPLLPDAIPASTTLTGSGDYAEYKDDSWPWEVP